MSSEDFELQPRDTLTENIQAHFPERNLVFDEPTRFALPRRALAVIAAWLVPGGGHMVLGRYGRGLIFFGTIASAFVLGLRLDGHLYWPTAAEPGSTFPFDLISVLWFFAEIGSGLCY